MALIDTLRLAVFVLSIIISSNAASDGVPQKNVFRFFTFVEHPYVFDGADTEPGLVIRYVEALMAKTKYRYSLEILPAKRALLEVQRHKTSCVFPVERSQEREVKFSWVSPILISRYGLFSPPSTRRSIQVLRDVGDLRIGSYLGSGIGEYLEDSGFGVDFASSDSANVTKLMAGRIDLWAADVRSASFIAQQAQVNLPTADYVFFTSLRAMACNKAIPDETINQMNDLLHDMYQSGEIKAIDDRFFSKNLDTAPR